MKYYRNISFKYYLLKKLLYLVVLIPLSIILLNIFYNKLLICLIIALYFFFIFKLIIDSIFYNKINSYYYTIFDINNISVHKTRYLIFFTRDILSLISVSSYLIEQGMLMKKFNFSKIIIFTGKNSSYFYVSDKDISHIEKKLKKIIVKYINNCEVSNYDN